MVNPYTPSALFLLFYFFHAAFCCDDDVGQCFVMVVILIVDLAQVLCGRMLMRFGPLGVWITRWCGCSSLIFASKNKARRQRIGTSFSSSTRPPPCMAHLLLLVLVDGPLLVDGSVVVELPRWGSTTSDIADHVGCVVSIG